MESANQQSAYGAASLDLSSEGIDGARSLLGVLTICADLVLSPQKPLYDGTEEEFQLVERMRQLPLVSENDLSASFSSGKSAARVEHVRKGKNIFCDVPVHAETNNVVATSSDPGFNIGGKAQKHLFQIPLRTIFVHALKSFGILDPVFTCVHLRGGFQVHIELTSDVPLCILSGSKYARMAGDVCATHELAEASAISEAFGHLSNMHNIVLVDISSRKDSCLLRTSRDFYGKVTAGLRMVDFMLQKWLKSLENLFQVEKFAYPKLKHGTDVESRFAEPVYQSLQFIKRDSMIQIRSFDAKLKELFLQKDKYVEATRSKSLFTSKASIKKAYFPEVDVLALFLQWFNLEGCQYGASIGDDGLYMGAVMLSFPYDQSVVPPGDMCIEARYPKKTVVKAHNCAAREAIFYLERQLNVEVAGYNHKDKVLAEEEMFLWKALNEETLLLGANVLKFWEDMLNKFDHSIHANKNHGTMIASHAGLEDGMAIIYDLLGRLESAAAKCTHSLKVTPKYCTLLELNSFLSKVHIMYD